MHIHAERYIKGLPDCVGDAALRSFRGIKKTLIYSALF